jgi:hypothetical protein
MYVSPLSAPEIKHNFNLLRDTFNMFNPDCPDCGGEFCPVDDFTYEIVSPTPTPTAGPSPILVAINITPSNPSIFVGDTIQMTATGIYSDGSSTDITNICDWQSMDFALITVNNDTDKGLVTGIDSGLTSVIASLNSINGVTDVSVYLSSQSPFQLGRIHIPDERDNRYLIKDHFQLIKSVTRVVPTTPTPTKTKTPTPTPTKTRSVTSTPTPTPTITPTHSNGVTPIPTMSVTPTKTGSPTPTPTIVGLTNRYWDDNMWWGNQGNTPQCVGYAWAHWIADGPITHTGVQPPISPTLIYQQAQLVDEWPGTNYDGTSVRGGAKYLNNSGKIGNYYWAYDVQTLINTILQLGPVVVGTNWYYNMFYPNSNGVISIGGSLAGGHAYVLNGVDTVNKLFRIKNSWGQSWGKSGHAFISFTDMTRLINENGEICLAIENNF